MMVFALKSLRVMLVLGMVLLGFLAFMSFLTHSISSVIVCAVFIVAFYLAVGALHGKIEEEQNENKLYRNLVVKKKTS